MFKMTKKQIKFGFELKTGKEISIPLAHTVVTGLTNESGKTTAIMGLIKRSGLKACIIKTKIGEKAISEGSIIPPFYKESFDWEYASELLESSRKEKLKFERSWIIKYSKTATNLLEFKRNIDNALAEGKLRELEKSVLITLQAYLEKILPELQYAPLSKTLDIKEGINIMDLERFKEETQSLIIRSILEEVLNKEKNTLIVLPEAWRYLPERISTPVKRPAEAFIRQGATNNNFLIIDSQDITGISKTILKQVSVWVLGYQREINEISRTIDQVPLPKKSKPKPEDIATLKLGHFFVATSEFTKKVYSQPSWMDDATAKNIALGKINIEDVEQPLHLVPYQIVTKKQEIIQSERPSTDFSKKLNELREDFISNRNDFFNKFTQINETISKIYSELFLSKQKPETNEDEIVMRVLQKLPMSQSSGSAINKEEIIAEVLSKIPKQIGSAVYEVAPLEAIKKRFLQEIKDRIIEDVKNISVDAKKVMKYAEARGVDVSPSEIITKCMLWKVGGSQSTKMSGLLKELLTIGAIQKTAGGRYGANLKDRIKSLMANHSATEQEIEQVYSHILANLL